MWRAEREPFRNRNRRALGLAAAVLGGLLALASCGGDEPRVEPSAYDGWVKYTYGHFVFRFSPVSRFSSDMAGFAKMYERILGETCGILEFPLPESTIYIFVYANEPEAAAIVGRDLPFSDDSAIHWGLPHSYGYQLTKYLLAKRGISPGRFAVINEGLPTLLDFSGINYHEMMTRLADEGAFAGLARLGDNTVFDSMAEDVRRGHSASLVGYIMYTYGPERVLALGNSQEGWQESIEANFQLGIDEFEENWLDFAREHSGPPEGAGQPGEM